MRSTGRRSWLKGTVHTPLVSCFSPNTICRCLSIIHLLFYFFFVLVSFQVHKEKCIINTAIEAYMTWKPIFMFSHLFDNYITALWFFDDKWRGDEWASNQSSERWPREGHQQHGLFVFFGKQFIVTLLKCCLGACLHF